MNIKVLSAALLVALLSASAAPMVGASSVIGATEPTQIANNVELVGSYLKQAEAVATQIKQYQAQLLALRQMDPSKLAGMLKGVAGMDNVDELLQTYNAARDINTRLESLSGNLRTIYREGQISADVLGNLHDRGIDLTGGQYFAAMNQLAEQRQGDYAARLTAFNNAMKQAQDDAKRVRALADAAPSIQTNVEGFGALMSASAVMSGQLASLVQGLNAQSAQQTEVAAMQAQQFDDQQQDRLRQAQLIRDMLAPKSTNTAPTK